MDNSSDLDPKLIAVFAAQFGETVADSITSESTMQDVEGWDSFTFIELITAIEEAFDTEFEFDELAEMNKVGAIQQAIEKRSSK